MYVCMYICVRVSQVYTFIYVWSELHPIHVHVHLCMGPLLATIIVQLPPWVPVYSVSRSIDSADCIAQLLPAWRPPPARAASTWEAGIFLCECLEALLMVGLHNLLMRVVLIRARNSCGFVWMCIGLCRRHGLVSNRCPLASA